MVIRLTGLAESGVLEVGEWDEWILKKQRVLQ